MEIIYFLLGVVIGGIIVWMAAKNKFKDEERNRLEQARSEALEWKVKHQSFVEHNQKMQEQMQGLFAEMAGNALEKNNRQFIGLAKEIMDKYIIMADSTFKKSEKEVSNIVEPLNKSLNNNMELIRQFEKQNSSLLGSLKSHLEGLQNSQRSLERETNALVGALKNPKIRGRWGEIGLKRIVEFSGLNEYCDFGEQVQGSENGKNYRPDMVIYLPDGKQLIVDAKVPLNAYLKSIEADNAEDEKEYLKQHAQAVNNHLNNLSSKAYWKLLDKSVDFVVLYMEVESAFGAALHIDKELILKGLDGRVIFATPSTFISILQSVAYSWKQQKSTANAEEIWKNVQTLHERLKIFYEHFEKIGKAAKNLLSAYNQSISSMDKRLMPVIRKIETLGSKTEKEALDLPDEIDFDSEE